MPFCPRCGLNIAGLEDDATRAGGAGTGVIEAPAGATPVESEARPATTDPTRAVAAGAAPNATPAGEDSAPTRSPGPGSLLPAEGRAFAIPPIVIAAVFVMVGLIAFGLLTRPQPGGTPGLGGETAPGTTVTPPAPPIVGLTILSPSDGQVVAAAEVTVIGTAPPGLSITQDISFGLDQHASVDGTGHWAIKVGLNEGDNKLTFRIGDDHSTERTVRVTYTPQRTP
jgi:hypothetical protein